MPPSRSGSLAWRPELAAAAKVLREDLAAGDPERLVRALDAEAARRLLGFMEGVRAYHAHPHRRTLADPPSVWSEGTTRLLDYGASARNGGAGHPVLVVPSLINRAYILDLAPRRSLMRDLARRGFRPFLVDWGAPGETERGFSLDDYVGGRLEAALEVVRVLAGRPAAVIGYCMGGLLALALAQRRPAEVGALVLMATPWDFHAAGDGTLARMRATAPATAAMIDAWGGLPVDVLQAMFASLDPFMAVRKFQRFAALDFASAQAKLFVVLEDWLNDGVPLAGPVARECLIGWYVENAPAQGAWRIRGRPVRPAEVAAPALVLVPAQDRIVPPASARPLGEALPHAEVRTIALGHIGMVAGGRAVRVVYGPLARWLRRRLS